VAAGGTLANLMFAVMFRGAAHAIRQPAPLRYFFWVLMTFNLLDKRPAFKSRDREVLRFFEVADQAPFCNRTLTVR
jgi:hypothetical protein